MEREEEFAEDQEEAPEERSEVVGARPVRVVAEWEESEPAFAQHFGISYQDFSSLILLLSSAQNRRYQRTLKVNKEAAILWAIHEGKSHGLLTEQGQ